MWRPDRLGPGVSLLREGSQWLEFSDPLETRVATRLEEVQPLLRWAEAQSCEQWVVGWVAFEAAPAFDSAFVIQDSSGPLAVFHVYNEPLEFDRLGPPRFQAFGLEATPDWIKADYLNKVGAIREFIAEGRVYQVNLTFPLRVKATGDPADLFCALAEAHAPPHAALLQHEDLTLLSLSPELFVRKQGSHLVSRPMKGTRPIAASAQDLASDPKDQAENLMIVDMIRNDLGRIAQPGTVEVADLFQVTDHGSVWQMTSSVHAEAPQVGLVETFTALFPCASVTGAPKVEAMRVIHELEPTPREAYCGAIGWLRPGGDFSFNVAIRTLRLQGSTATYAVGSGVVWDSDPEAEWQECMVKAEALRGASPWSLLETVLWNGEEFVLLDEHLKRMAASAAELGWAFCHQHAKSILLASVSDGRGQHRVRLLLHSSGNLKASAEPLTPWPSSIRAVLCPFPIASDDPWLRHKTTRRGVYERARAACPGADEVLLWNERDELCEFTQGNVVLELDGRRMTPPLDSGALPGVARAAALSSRELSEQTLRREDLSRASRIWLLNSVRGWIPISWEYPRTWQ